MTRVGLEFRLYRFQILVSVLVALALAVAAAVVVVQIAAIGLPRECFSTELLTTAATCPESALEAMSGPSWWANQLWMPLTIAPWMIGIVLGATVVAQETELHTALFTWTITRSRRRWLLRKAALLGGLAASLGLVSAIASDRLFATQFPMLDGWAHFDLYSARGPIHAAHAFVAFGVALMVGAICGRILPALVLSTLAASIVGGFVWFLFGSLAPLTPVSVDAGTELDGSAFVAERYQVGPSGPLVSWDEALLLSPIPQGQPGWRAWMSENTTIVYLGYQGNQFPEIVLREMVLCGFAGLACIAGATFVVDRRSPY